MLLTSIKKMEVVEEGMRSTTEEPGNDVKSSSCTEKLQHRTK